MRLSEELQVHYCYATEGPIKLAAALMSSGGGGGDCLAQVSHGSDSLKNPEPGFYIIGVSSPLTGTFFFDIWQHLQQHLCTSVPFFADEVLWEGQCFSSENWP